MFTFLRRAVATLLVAGGLLLASTGALLGADDHTMPAALMLVLTGGAVLLLRHRGPRPATHPRPVARTDAWVAPAVVAPRPAPRCAIPTPRPSPERAVPAGGAPTGSAGSWRAPRTGGARYGVRHCVLPRGAVPHQRRASDGS